MSGPLVYQSLWAMEGLPWRAEHTWQPAEWIEAIAQASFDGVAIDLGARQAPAADAIAPLLAGAGLEVAVLAFVRDDAGLDDALRYADAVGARRMVVCAQIYAPTPGDQPARAATVAHWVQRAADAGVRLELETHRNTLTNDLRATVALLDHLDPAVDLALDLSHYVAGCELPDEPDDEVEDLVRRLLTRVGSLQGRVATRGQVQVPLTFPQHAAWAARFRGWWTAGFQALAQRYPGERPLFVCELGTRPYAITGADGHELSDRWEDALLLRRWAIECHAAAAAHPEGGRS